MNIDLNLVPNDDEFLFNSIDLNSVPNDELSSTDTDTTPDIVRPPNKKKNLTENQLRAVIQMLAFLSRDGKLPKGTINKVASHFSISRRSVSRIWHDRKNSIINGYLDDVSSKLVKRVGAKRVEVDPNSMKSIPFRRRTNIRSLASALHMGKSTVHRRVKERILRPHSNAVKPHLTEENKKVRVQFCLSMVNEDILGSKHLFKKMYDRIHIDEKWFYMSKASQKYYLHSDEVEPLRTCKSKRFIAKIMFLTAVARPRYDANSNIMFDGKIGIWPFVVEEPAKRSSKNRVAGTLETKSILSVKKNTYRSYLVEKLLPSIKEKWPDGTHETIFIQQDNAKPHIDVNDVEFLEAVNKFDLNVRLCCQPPNSPDLNVLDLGFFRAIESLQHQEAPNSINELVSCVEKAFFEFPVENLNNVFLTLQTCMVEILKDFGGNNYSTPHMNKKKLIRNGNLPICIECDSQVLKEAKEFIGEREEI